MKFARTFLVLAVDPVERSLRAARSFVYSFLSYGCRKHRRWLEARFPGGPVSQTSQCFDIEH